jgi:hypothetical protein
VLPVVWLVVAVVVAVALTTWITFTITRLDRLHARCDAAQAALDAQLVRRAAALARVAESVETGLPVADRAELDTVARAALDPHHGDLPGAREGAENAVGRAVADLAGRPGTVRAEGAAELREAATRVMIARRFYNDAVRDTRALRARRLPRLLHLAGTRGLPQFFDIDDTVPEPGVRTPALTSSTGSTPSSAPITSPNEQDRV